MKRDLISVVVPTRDRPEALVRCRAALGTQTVEVEILVSEDHDGRGPAWARNAGWRRAGSDVVLFCDDDCEPQPEWAAALAAACPANGSAAGETVTADPDDALAAASQFLTSQLQRSSLRNDGRLGFAPTSNLAASRDLLQRVPFDESFPRAAGEDRDWCARADAAGGAPVFAPEAVVLHRQQLGGLRGFLGQQMRYGQGAALLRSRRIPLAGPQARLELIRGALREGLTTGALAIVAQLAVACGFTLQRLRPGAAIAPEGRTRQLL